MSTVATRAGSRFADMLDWLESGSSLAVPFGVKDAGFVRVEDFRDGDTYVVRAELPGVDPDKDIDIHVEGDLLTIHGERREEKREKGHSEFHYGSFSRSITMPHGTDPEAITATYTDGLLEVRMPVAPAETSPTKISVTRPES
ncbi:Hsp20/alpha crystallin family protein [Nocardioides pacificus]